jgi:hypothetical protein
MIDRHGGVQWPLPEGAPLQVNERRLFEDGRYFTPDGRAKLLFAEPQPMPEAPSADYPTWKSAPRTRRRRRAAEREGRGQLAPRNDRGARLRHALGAARARVHPDALRDHEPAHVPGVRSVLAAAELQGVRGGVSRLPEDARH